MVWNCTDVCDQHPTRKTRDNIHAQVTSEHVRVKWLNQHTAHLQLCLELSTILVLHMQSHSACICMYTKRNQRTKLLPHGCHSEDTKYRQNSLDHREMGNRSAKQTEDRRWIEKSGDYRDGENWGQLLGVSPVHEVHEHLGIFLELPHLHSVWQNTVEVS